MNRETLVRSWPFAASDLAYDSRLRGAALPALVLLEKWTGADGRCDLRLGRLCGQLHQSRRTIEMAVNAIVSAGYYRRR